MQVESRAIWIKVKAPEWSFKHTFSLTIQLWIISSSRLFLSQSQLKKRPPDRIQREKNFHLIKVILSAMECSASASVRWFLDREKIIARRAQKLSHWKLENYNLISGSIKKSKINSHLLNSRKKLIFTAFHILSCLKQQKEQLINVYSPNAILRDI